MSDLDVEQKFVIASNDDVNFNQVFNKIKPSLKSFTMELPGIVLLII